MAFSSKTAVEKRINWSDIAEIANGLLFYKSFILYSLGYLNIHYQFDLICVLYFFIFYIFEIYFLEFFQ